MIKIYIDNLFLSKNSFVPIITPNLFYFVD